MKIVLSKVMGMNGLPRKVGEDMNKQLKESMMSKVDGTIFGPGLIVVFILSVPLAIFPDESTVILSDLLGAITN